MPRPKQFTVSLTVGDRAKPKNVVASGRHRARMITRARVLLALDETAETAPDRRVVAEHLGTSESTVYLVAKAFTTHAPHDPALPVVVMDEKPLQLLDDARPGHAGRDHKSWGRSCPIHLPRSV